MKTLQELEKRTRRTETEIARNFKRIEELVESIHTKRKAVYEIAKSLKQLLSKSTTMEIGG